jgi:hypothetical protein
VTAASARGTEPLDLESAAAAVLADSAPFAFTYKGLEYTVPAQVTWPVGALSAIARGELDKALDQLLGEAEFQRLSEAGIRLGELNVLFEEMAKAAGMDGLPNSPKPARRGSART